MFNPSPQSWTELGFLFEPSTRFTNNDNTTTIRGANASLSGYTVIYKDKTSTNTAGIINHIKNNVNSAESKNPYADLISKFASKPGMRLRPSDFAYLTDLGVYPINRMWILRRFSESVTVPDNLDEWVFATPDASANIPLPIATVVGWLQYDEKDIKISFNEVWKNKKKCFIPYYSRL